MIFSGQLILADLSHIGSLVFGISFACLGLAAVYAIVRAFWLYKGANAWPTADGTITHMEIQEFYAEGTGSPNTTYFASVGYDFRDTKRMRCWGQWQSRQFATSEEASAFVQREMPEGKRVVVRFNPKDPMVNSLELDSWTYSGDRPLSLNF